MLVARAETPVAARRQATKAVDRLLNIFFFSSRRRHTRSTRDWSSDVCSSDIPFYWMLVTSFKQNRDLYVGASDTSHIPWIFNDAPTLEHVKLLLGQTDFPRWVLRSEERRVGKEGPSERSVYVKEQ